MSQKEFFHLDTFNMQKLLFTNKAIDVNEWLDKGWAVVKIVPAKVLQPDSDPGAAKTFAILLEKSSDTFR